MLRDLIRPFIEPIVKRDITAREVARLLGVNEATVCRTLKQLKIKREPTPDLAAKRALATARRAFRLEAAATMSVEAAARAANCSTRTIYRLRKHHDAQKPQPDAD